MDPLRSLLETHGSDEMLIHRLWRVDPLFRTVCEDLVIARDALNRWRGDPMRETDYREIVDRLYREIEEFLSRARRKA